jgi:hypothetical protein
MTTKPAKLSSGPYRFEAAETADTYRIFAAGDDKPMVEMIYIGGEEDFAAAALGLARLFVAGPKLLEALESMIRWTELHGLNVAQLLTGQHAEVPVVINARKAVTEATGRAA